MLSTTVLTWSATGVLITLFNAWLSGLGGRDGGRIVFACIVTALFAGLFGWTFMTSFSPWLVSTYFLMVVLALISAALTGTEDSAMTVVF